MRFSNGQDLLGVVNILVSIMIFFLYIIYLLWGSMRIQVKIFIKAQRFADQHLSKNATKQKDLDYNPEFRNNQNQTKIPQNQQTIIDPDRYDNQTLGNKRQYNIQTSKPQREFQSEGDLISQQSQNKNEIIATNENQVLIHIDCPENKKEISTSSQKQQSNLDIDSSDEKTEELNQIPVLQYTSVSITKTLKQSTFKNLPKDNKNNHDYENNEQDSNDQNNIDFDESNEKTEQLDVIPVNIQKQSNQVKKDNEQNSESLKKLERKKRNDYLTRTQLLFEKNEIVTTKIQKNFFSKYMLLKVPYITADQDQFLLANALVAENNFYLIYDLTRLIILNSIVVFFVHSPFYGIIFLTIIQVLYSFLAIFKYPNDSKFDKVVNLLIEFIISACYVISLFWATYDHKENYYNDDQRQKLGSIFLQLAMLITYIVFGVMFIRILQILFNVFYSICNKKKKKKYYINQEQQEIQKKTESNQVVKKQTISSPTTNNLQNQFDTEAVLYCNTPKQHNDQQQLQIIREYQS